MRTSVCGASVFEAYRFSEVLFLSTYVSMYVSLGEGKLTRKHAVSVISGHLALCLFLGFKIADMLQETLVSRKCLAT